MQTDHNRIVDQIQRKMAGPSMLKSEEEKKQEIFEYGRVSEQSNFDDFNNKSSYRTKQLISSSQAEKNLQQIYDYYVNSYIQPRQHINIFDSVNERKLTFQPFILFMKNFRLLKIIFTLDKVKLFFKKYSNFGQYLTCQNFIFLINQLSHSPEAKQFFNIQAIRQQQNLDAQSVQEMQRQQLYSYMNLQNPQKFRMNFKNVFQPFQCKSKIDTKKIKYSYRKFSQPELLKKSFPLNKNKTEEKQLYVVKNREVPVNDNPFGQIKSIVVSWQSLRSKSLANLQKNSQSIIRKKYLKDDPDDDDYLRQYGGKQQNQKKQLQRKIDQITKQQTQKNKLLLAKLQKRTKPKSFLNVHKIQ